LCDEPSTLASPGPPSATSPSSLSATSPPRKPATPRYHSQRVVLEPRMHWKATSKDPLAPGGAHCYRWPLDDLTVPDQEPLLRKGFQARCEVHQCRIMPPNEMRRLEERLATLSPRRRQHVRHMHDSPPKIVPPSGPERALWLHNSFNYARNSMAYTLEDEGLVPMQQSPHPPRTAPATHSPRPLTTRDTSSSGGAFRRAEAPEDRSRGAHTARATASPSGRPGSYLMKRNRPGPPAAQMLPPPTNTVKHRQAKRYSTDVSTAALLQQVKVFEASCYY